MRVAPEIVLSEDERRELVLRVGSKLSSVRAVQRARIVLLAADGKQNKDIAVTWGIGRVQVARWRERYREQRLVGIEREPHTHEHTQAPLTHSHPHYPDIRHQHQHDHR